MGFRIYQAATTMDQIKAAVVDDFALRGIPARASVGTLCWLCYLFRRAIALVTRNFVAANPVLFPVLADLETLSLQRTIVLAVQLFGSICCSGVYYQQSGHAVSLDSDPSCVQDDFEKRLQTAIPVSIVSTLVGSCPSQILYNMVTARPRGALEVTSMYMDLFVSFLFYALGLGLCSFYLLYIAAFLANVHERAAQLWALTILSTVLSSLLVVPLAQSLLLVPMVVFKLWRTPSMLDTIFSDEPEEEVAQDKDLHKKGEGDAIQSIRIFQMASEVPDSRKSKPGLQGTAKSSNRDFSVVVPFASPDLPGQVPEQSG